MAGLDASDSPFNNTSRDHMPRFNKSSSKSNGYSGDISSDGRINGSFGIPSKQMNGNVRPKPYLTSNVSDPTMKSGYLDESHDEAQRRRDELYERILQETSNAFRNIGEQDLTINITGDTTRTQDESVGQGFGDDTKDRSIDLKPVSPEKSPQKSRIPRFGSKKKGTDSDTEAEKSVRSEHLESIKGPGGEIIMSLSPFDDDGLPEGDSQLDSPDRRGNADDNFDDSRVASPNKGGRASDFSYGMESFEQSYLSERGEVVHLGDEDFFPDSPSPIRQHSDNEEF